MTTPRDALEQALAEVDRQVERCMALADAAGLSADERHEGAETVVSAYEAADRRVEAMLAAILAAGGAPGLLGALSDAATRAAERAGQPLGIRARAVAQHAYERALSREQQVITTLALPYWCQRLEGRDAAA
jgi:hypothetical protein